MNIAIAMLIGLVGTSVIHVSKGLMKLGLMRLRPASEPDSGTVVRRGRAIYLCGIFANFTTPFWVMIANLFAPTVFYTSMYGLGLVSLLLFSHCVLKEHYNRTQILGAGVIILGTAMLAGGEIAGHPAMLGRSHVAPLLVIAGSWIVVAIPSAMIARSSRLAFQETLFGLFAGGMAALDALLKGVAQQYDGTPRFIPTDPIAIAILVASFLFAAGAFAMIQWSFLRRCRAGMMGSVYDLSYIGVPVLLFAALRPEYGLSLANMAGIITLALGALLVNRHTRNAPGPHGTGETEPAVQASGKVSF